MILVSFLCLLSVPVVLGLQKASKIQRFSYEIKQKFDRYFTHALTYVLTDIITQLLTPSLILQLTCIFTYLFTLIAIKIVKIEII